MNYYEKQMLKELKSLALQPKNWKYFEVSRSRARWPWSHFRVHIYDTYLHIVWGKISLVIGFPGLEEIEVCSYCSESVEGVGAGDECWTVCPGCRAIEGETHYVLLSDYEKIHG